MLYTLCTIMYVQRVSCKRSGEYTWKKKLSFFNVRAVNVRRIELTLSSAFVVPIFFGYIICCFSIYFSISFLHPKLLQMIDSLARSFIPSFAQTNFVFALYCHRTCLSTVTDDFWKCCFFIVSRMDRKMSTNHNKYKQFKNPQFVLALSQATDISIPFHLFGEVFFVRCLLATNQILRDTDCNDTHNQNI